jgi:hypothetical protein
MQTIDYTDTNGIKRRVALPDGVTADVSEGIPISLDLSALYPHMPLDFVRSLTDELWARDLVEPRHFLAPGAHERIRAALLSVVKEDTLSIITYAKGLSS